MATRVPDISKFQLIQRYWDGANSYIRLKWTENGFTPEFSPLSELEIAAERYENAENLRNYKARRTVREDTVGLHTASRSMNSFAPRPHTRLNTRNFRGKHQPTSKIQTHQTRNGGRSHLRTHEMDNHMDSRIDNCRQKEIGAMTNTPNPNGRAN
jgi:hypothetical protein